MKSGENDTTDAAPAERPRAARPYGATARSRPHPTMALLERETFIPAPRDEVFAFFGDPANLARITPAALGFTIVEAPARTLRAGDRIRYRIRLFGFPVTWVTHIAAWDPGTRFVDEQQQGPYRRWVHEHLLEDAPGGTRMRDRVEYALPLGRVGSVAGGWWVRRALRKIFDFRADAIRRLFPGETAPSSRHA